MRRKIYRLEFNVYIVVGSRVRRASTDVSKHSAQALSAGDTRTYGNERTNAVVADENGVAKTRVGEGVGANSRVIAVALEEEGAGRRKRRRWW